MLLFSIRLNVWNISVQGPVVSKALSLNGG